MFSLWLCIRSAEGDPGNGIEPGTKFEELPDDRSGPVCGAAKDEFEKKNRNLRLRARRPFDGRHGIRMR